MKKFLKIAVALIYISNVGMVPSSGQTGSETNNIPTLKDVKLEQKDIVIELSQMMPYKVNNLVEQSKLIIDITGALYKTGFTKKDLETDLIKRVRGYQFKENPLIARVVIDLKDPVDYKTFDNNDNNIVISVKRSDVLKNSGTKKQDIKAKSTASGKKDLLNALPKEVVTLDFEGADIRDVVRLMAETSNINMIYGPEVGGNISVHLKNVPFDEAFRTIMNLKGLVATQLGNNILRITTPEILQKEQAKAILFTKTIPVNYVKADEMQKHILAVMNSAGRKGSISVVEASNSLVITDTQDGIAQSERLIAQLDKKPPQVLIEARIVEINLSDGFDIGVQWEYSRVKTKNERTKFIGTQDSGARIMGEAPDGTSYGPGSPPMGTGVELPASAGNAAITFGFISNSDFLAVSLAALVTQSKAKILAAPKVVTINGKEAKIEAVQDIRFRTSTVTGTGVVSNSFTLVSAGIKLNVTPTINAEDQITLQIKPESSFPTEEEVGAGPIIRTRTAETTVIVKDGETLAIGGMIDDRDTEAVRKVPLLGDIPILGVFFRNNTNSKQRNELLVFVTPRIIRE